MNYRQKLNSIPWRKKRQEILMRDNFTCRCCKTKKADMPNLELHVHHKNYFPDTEPWDYDNSYLVTLCEECHFMEEAYKRQVQAVVDDLHLRGVSYHEIFEFLTKNEDELLKNTPYGQKV